MKTYTKNNPITIISISLIVIVLYFFITADPPGYCSEQKRFLSDDEFIEIALRHEVSRGEMSIDGSDVAIRSFLAAHPNCCRVLRGGDKYMQIDSDNVLVTVTYEVNERAAAANEKKYYESNLVITPCGTVGRFFGQGIKALPAGY